MDISYKKNTISKEVLKNFLIQNDKFFITPLSEGLCILDYAEKIYRNAEIFEAYCNNELVGILCMYANNKLAGYAYITLIMVIPNFRNRKIASVLMNNAVNYAKENGFFRIGLNVSPYNKTAIKLYENNGFKFKKIYMEKSMKNPSGGGEKKRENNEYSFFCSLII